MMVKTKTTKVRLLAEQTERQLNAIQRRVRQQLNAEFAQGELTGPQRLVMAALVGTKDGMSLKGLSSAVNLAHSTVSGIVDRLVKRGLVVRTTGEEDRRVSRVTASPEVRDFLQKKMSELTITPLVEALGKASVRERALVTDGLNTLARLLGAETPD